VPSTTAGFHSPLVRAARSLHQKKHRQERRCFLVEGPTAVGALLGAPSIEVEDVFVLPGNEHAQATAAIARGRGLRVHSVDERTMRGLSQTQTPQGIVASARFFHREIAALGQVVGDAPASIVLVLNDVADPGNAGTLIRSAEAFGAACVCVGSAAVDPYNEKLIRASMGSIFRVPLCCYERWDDLVAAARDVSLTIAGAEAGAADVRLVTLPLRGALVVGHERHGLPGSIQLRVGIPQFPSAESLNAAVAGSLLLYEMARAAGTIGERQQRTSDT
jgi:RNA methyltransferase, TrmH family